MLVLNNKIGEESRNDVVGFECCYWVHDHRIKVVSSPVRYHGLNNSGESEQIRVDRLRLQVDEISN